MVIEVINKYQILLDNIAKLIEVSGYRQDYLSNKLSMSPATFSAKKAKGNWSTVEVEALMKIIVNEDVEDFLMGLYMQSIDENDDDLVSLSELKKALK